MPLGYIPGSHKGTYAEFSHRLFGTRKFSRNIEFRIIKSWLPKTPSRVLDVGGGDGELAVQLELLGHQVTVLDFSHAALKGGAAAYPFDINFINGDATFLPFQNDSFDLVVCNSALEHFPNDEQAIIEMSRVLKEGGTLLITTDSFPASASRWLRLIPASWRREGMRDNRDLLESMRAHHRKNCFVVNFYKAEELLGKLERAGMKADQWRYYMNGLISKGIYEIHILVKWFDFYNRVSRRLYPLFFPFTLSERAANRGYGLAVRSVKRSLSGKA